MIYPYLNFTKLSILIGIKKILSYRYTALDEAGGSEDAGGAQEGRIQFCHRRKGPEGQGDTEGTVQGRRDFLQCSDEQQDDREALQTGRAVQGSAGKDHRKDGAVGKGMLQDHPSRKDDRRP